MGGKLGEKVVEIAEGFNASQSDYKVTPVYKGNYTETMTAAIAAFRAKQQPHIVQVFEVGTASMMAAKGAIYPVYPDDGGCGRGLRSEGLSRLGHRLLHRYRRQHAVHAVQQLDAGALLQQDRVREGRHRRASGDMAGSRGRRHEGAGRGAIPAVSRPAGSPGSRSRISPPGTTCPSARRPTASPAPIPSSSSQSGPCQAYRTTRRVAEVEGLRLWRPAFGERAEILRAGMRDVHELVRSLCRG